jgi:cytochrome c-type biogenesis protein CcmH
MIWIVIALLTGLAALSVLVPLARSREGIALEQVSREFYLQQKAELERERDRGLISADEFTAAQAEAARRLIAVHGDTDRPTVVSTLNRRLAAVIPIVVVPALALGLYAWLGSPALKDRPLEARLNAPPGQIEVVAAVARIEKHLRKNPTDGRGWQVIAPVYMRLKRYDEAVTAWSNALRFLGPSADRYSALGEARFFAAKGKVTPDAMKAFDAALEIDPKHNQSLFFTGVAAEQSGDVEKARERWNRLIAAAPAGAPWTKTIRERLAALDAKAGPAATGTGPASDAGKAIAALPAGDRAAAIRSMVEGLAARLKDNGKDINGWLMLIRAYGVLNEKVKAVEALKQARAIFATDRAALKSLQEQARSSGLEAGQ